jgi:phosphoglycerate dehydrogenase-like enzyme
LQIRHILVNTTREFALAESHLQQIKQAAPEARVTVKPRRDLTLADLEGVDVLFGWPNPDWVAQAPDVRWVQLGSAGSNGWHSIRPNDLLLTKASGTFGVPIAEWVLGTMLMLTRNLHLYRDQQHTATWKVLSGAREIHGATVGIVGLGDIGREVARRVSAFGCRVLGARRTAGGETLPFVDEVLPLDELIPQADFLVLAMPGTPETDRMINAGRLAAMKPGAHLINVGRGSTVDEAALADALRSGHLAGAALDVTTVEPLPADSPLWQMPQVILTPHSSGISPQANADRLNAIFCENLRRYQAGEPLINVVDRKAGY